MIADLLHYLIIFQIRVQQEGGGHFNAVIVQVILEGYPVGFPEELAQVRAVDLVFQSQILKRQVLCVVLPDILFHVVHDAASDIFAAQL